MTAPRPLAASGDRVHVRTVEEGDLAAYRTAVLASRERLRVWNPANPDDLRWHLSAQSDLHRTFMILARDPRGDHGIVGKVNVTNVVRGRFQSAVMGYDSYDPYAGQGLFREGLALIVGLAFARDGMDLHRVEANVQPGNAVSAGMLRSLGFRKERFIPRMLYLSDAQGRDAWRDHDAYAVTREEWPAPAYAPHDWPYLAAVVTGRSELRGDLARALSVELGVPRLALELIGDPALLLRIAQECPTGVVLDVPELAGPLAGLQDLLPVIDVVREGLGDSSDLTASRVSRIALRVRGHRL